MDPELVNPVVSPTQQVTAGEVKTHQPEPIHSSEMDPELVNPVVSSTQQVTAGDVKTQQLDPVQLEEGSEMDPEREIPIASCSTQVTAGKDDSLLNLRKFLNDLQARYKHITRRTDLVSMAVTMLQEHRSGTSHDKNPDTLPEDKLLILRIKLGEVALEGILNKGGVKIHFNKKEFGSEDIVTSGCNVGLLTRLQYNDKSRVIYHVRFFHKMFQEHCAATYIAQLPITSSEFKQSLDKILQCDLEIINCLLIFCCGMNKEVATEIITRIVNAKLKQNPEDEDFIIFTNVLLYESDLGSLVEWFSKVWKKDEWGRWSGIFFLHAHVHVYGEELLAMNYVMKHAPPNTIDMHPYPEYTILICHSLADLILVKDIVQHTSCINRLTIRGANITGNVVQLQNIVHGMTDLKILNCVMTADDTQQLFRALTTSRIDNLALSGNNLHGLLPIELDAIPSLRCLYLTDCGLTSCDVGAVFTLLSSLVKIMLVHLGDNNLHGIQHTHTTPINSLSRMFLGNCGLTSCDVGAVFKLLSSLVNIETVDISDNNLHGVQHTPTTPIKFLRNMYIKNCGLTSCDVGEMFKFLSSLVNIDTVDLSDNNLHGIQHTHTTPNGSLRMIHIKNCGLTDDDFEALFSILSRRGQPLPPGGPEYKVIIFK